MPQPPQLSEQEEFEFRARAEAEAAASAPAQQKISPPIPTGMQPGQQPTDADQPHPLNDALSFAGGIPKGVQQGAHGIADIVTNPIGSAIQGARAIPKAIGSGVQALRNPSETLQKVKDYLRNLKPEQAGETVGSTLIGGAGGKAAGVLGDVAGPALKAMQKPVSSTVRDLAGKGVVMTPGMRGGKIASALEQRATSILGVGDMIKNARGETVKQWNRAELNDAIKDAGGKEIPKGRTGRDAIAHTEQQMHQRYGEVLGKMHADLNSADPAGMTFRQFLEQTKQMAGQGLEPSSAKIVTDMIDGKVIGKFTQYGRASGETVKEIQETLRTEINDLKSGTYQERKAAEALKQVSADMKAMLKRENPKLAGELDNVDRGYSKFKASSKAALASVKNQGHYTPAQKSQAIRARDKSKDKQRFASGTAHGQKEAEAVESVIGNTEPDSGSAGRIATMEALFGGGAILGHPGIAAAGLGGSAMYTQPVLKFLQNRALKKGGPYKPFGAGPTAAGAIAGTQTDEQGLGQ